MMNYVKSEFYRITHTRGIYGFTGILMLLSVLMNTGIHFLGGRYANTSFSYSYFVSNPMMFAVMGLVIAYFLYEGNKKNGSLKNTIASGISRTKVFVGECIVGIITAILVMVVTVGVYIASAELFLKKAEPVELKELLLEVPAVFLIAMACLISGIVCMELFDKIIVGIIVWCLVWFIIPKILMYLGLRFEAIHDIAMWLPDNFFGVNGLHVNTQECITIWDTTSGWARCMLSGAIGVVIFTLSGIVSLRKRDL